MGMYGYVQKSFSQSFKERSPAYRKRLMQYRKGATIQRVEKPTNIARAHVLGYKARKDFEVVRVRVPRGKRRRRAPDLGRKPAKNRKFENPGKPWQWFAAQRAGRKFKNLEIVNSYWVGEDGRSQYYEVILRNPHSGKPKLKPKRL